MGRKIEPAELQKLAMMPEAKIARLCQDRQRMDGADARHLAKALIIRMLTKELVSVRFNHIALPNQTARFGQNQPEHRNCSRVEGHRQGRRGTGSFINIAGKRAFDHFASDDIPGFATKAPLAKAVTLAS